MKVIKPFSPDGFTVISVGEQELDEDVAKIGLEKGCIEKPATPKSKKKPDRTPLNKAAKVENNK